MNVRKTGELIACKRKEHGLSTDELSKILCVSAEVLHAWEMGASMPDIPQLSALAAELGVNILELLNGCEQHREIDPDPYENDAPLSPSVDEYSLPLTIVTDESEGSFVSPLLFGHNLEHTRSCVYKGLSAQLLRNRKFAGIPESGVGCAAEWYAVGDSAYISFTPPYTRHDPGYRKGNEWEQHALRIAGTQADDRTGIGQNGLYIEKDRGYEFALVAKAPENVKITAVLTSRKSEAVYAAAEFAVDCSKWIRYALPMQPTQADDDASLQITFSGPGVVYIGAVSLLPSDHFHGMRRDVIERMREIVVKMLRWPGGNFAGDYHWKDGLMPVDMRGPFMSSQRKTNAHSMGYDYSEINTDDFIALCRELGAEPSITINPGWNTPEESAAWVEYCNGDITTKYGRLRIERGFEKPYNVKLWSLGNEFGHGHMEGANTPEGYARMVHAHAAKMLEVTGNLSLCASGAYPRIPWTASATHLLAGVSDMVAMHFYAYQPRYEENAEARQEYYRCLASARKIRNMMLETRRQMDEMNEEIITNLDEVVFVDLPGSLSHIPKRKMNRKVYMAFDEWNVWNAWYRPSSVSDGMYTALILHMLIHDAESLGIALSCYFEPVNEGAISVKPGHADLTAQGQVFSLMKHHAGGKKLFASRFAAVTENGEGIITLTAMNASFDEEKEIVFPDHMGDCIRARLLVGEMYAPPSWFREDDVLTQVCGGSIKLPPRSLLAAQYRKA